MNNDIVFSYFVTSDKFYRLEKSISEQIKIGLGISQNSYLITDGVPNEFPDVLRDFFGDRIFSIESYVLDRENNKAFSFSKLRNGAIQAARNSTKSWMFFCDADTVITKISLPNSGTKYALPYVYWQKEADESVWESVRAIEKGGESAFSEGNSWFVIHRDVFGQLDFNEQIIGYGWEDLEFSVRVQASGFAVGRCDTHVVHLFHTQEERQVHWQQFQRNQKIFEAVQLGTQNKYLPDWRNSELLEARHHEWVANLYLDYTAEMVVNLLSKTANPFSVIDENIVIRWNDWPAELFRRDGACLQYVGPH
ncbi:hypothetical protein EKPJFOCH_1509 [Methylobacterium thuringiense]|uniref:Glycosyltransferase n=2 Tax=Methylobacterium thuringiense TaxID=1003091 RepID=A0ABQ4TKE9_9HYPH|nr:hypothetical protein EKPJFOCH_1509 [Methylobacterium thuringiense]